jgi:hypothetical protein
MWVFFPHIPQRQVAVWENPGNPGLSSSSLAGFGPMLFPELADPELEAEKLREGQPFACFEGLSNPADEVLICAEDRAGHAALGEARFGTNLCRLLQQAPEAEGYEWFV